MSAHELIIASAGSGKTFQISSRIIAALARGVAASEIFASTFTRAAAGEILERVLLRMSRAALDPDEAAALSWQLADLPEAPSPRDMEQWRALLYDTARELHEFEVGTLDAWFQRTARTFGHELGFPPGWGIAEDSILADLRADVLDEVLSEGDRGQVLQLIREIHDGEARRSVQGTLVKTVDTLVDIEAALTDGVVGWSASDVFLEEGPPGEEVFDALISRWEAMDIPTTKTGSPRAAWTKARDAAVEALRAGDWESFAGKGVFKAFANAADETQATFSGALIESDVVELLRDTAVVAGRDLAETLAARGRALGRLAGAYHAAWQARLEAGGQLGFDDVARQLSGPRDPARRTDFGYRMGGTISNLLLDEFQDTSLLQWRVIRPLLDRVVDRSADGARATVVADPKQSIYGWRGGAPVVLRALKQDAGFRSEAMAGSFRSCAPVLNTVNEVFRGIEDTAAITKQQGDVALAGAWKDDFETHTVRLRPNEEERPGEVVLRVGPREKPDTGDDLLTWAADRIVALADRHPDATVGVLARTNATVARLITDLAERGLAASEEGGTRIADSAAVVAVLSLLRMLDHPRDGLARWHVASGPLGAAVKFTHASSDADALTVSKQFRRRLVEDGYGPTLHDLEERVRDACDARDRKRLAQLTQLGHAWDASGSAGVRVDPFVERALQAKAELPGESRVRVMTIHRSKGLEFDVVVLPELHASMFGGGSAPALPYRPDAHGAVTHVFPSVPGWQRRFFAGSSELSGALEQARDAEVRDALGVLYVGMTRAKHALHLLVPEDPEGKSKARSPARILVERLVPDAFEAGYEFDPSPGVEPLWTHPESDESWDRVLEPRPGLGSETGPGVTRIGFARVERRRMLDRRSPSSEPADDDGPETEGALDLEGVLGEDTTTATDRGSVVHGWLEAVEWGAEASAPKLPDAERLRVLARRAVAGVSEAEIQEWRVWLEARLEAAEIAAVFDRDRYPVDADVRLEVELPFLWKDRRGHVMVEGFIDRLVLVEREGVVVAAEIIDWKTNAIAADDAKALQDKLDGYTPQIRRYREAVCDLYGLPPEQVRGTLVFLDPGRVRDVSVG